MNLELLLIPLIIGVTFFSAAIFGFGAGLVAVPLISLLIPVRDAVTLVLIFQLCMGIVAWRSYRDIAWRVARPMTITTLVGTVAGTVLLSSVSAMVLELSLAAAIAFFLVKTIWFNSFHLGSDKHHIAMTGSGLIGGLFQGMIGTGGPVLTMYLAVALPRKAALRATLLYLFTITSVARLAISIPQHLFSTAILQLALISVPFFIAAIIAGQRVQNRVSEHAFRTGIYGILAISALALLSKAFF